MPPVQPCLGIGLCLRLKVAEWGGVGQRWVAGVVWASTGWHGAAQGGMGEAQGGTGLHKVAWSGTWQKWLASGGMERHRAAQGGTGQRSAAGGSGPARSSYIYCFLVKKA